MIEEKYFVHRTTVQSYRKSLVNYLFSIKKSRDIPKIVSSLSNLDNFIGDKIPLSIVEQEFELVVAIFKDDYIWLKIFNYIDISNTLLYDGIRLCADPIYNKRIEVPLTIVCRLITNYIILMTDSVTIKMTEKNDDLCLEFEFAAIFSNSKYHIDAILFTVYKLLCTFSNKKPNNLILSYRENIRDLSLYRKYFATAAKLSNKKTHICYRPRDSERNQTLFSISSNLDSFLKTSSFIGPIHSLLIEISPNISYSIQCQKILLTIIGVFDPNREQVAKVLNMSVSSLQRRLKQEGTSFQKILLDIRKKLAHRYLVEQNLPPSSVALLLGYRSSSQFFTAFKSWFSITPKTYQIKNNLNIRKNYSIE